MLFLRWLPVNEAVSLSFLAAMVVDLVCVALASAAMAVEATRQVYAHWRANRWRMVERTVSIAFVSIGLLRLLGKDVHQTSVLPPNLRISNYFVALFTAWKQLRMGLPSILQSIAFS